MADIKSIIDKVKKLRTLAGNNSCEAEVKAALLVADKLIQEYRLSESQIEAQTGVSSDPLVRLPVPNGDSKNRSSWKEYILEGLCLSYGACYYIQKGGGCNYIVCSRESDHAVIAYLFEVLCEDGKRLAKDNNPITRIQNANGPVEMLAAIEACPAGIGRSARDAVGYAKSYLEGFGRGVYTQLYRAVQDQKTANTSSAMVLLSNRKEIATLFMNKEVNNLKTTSGLRGARSDGGARNAGFSAGMKANVNKGLGSGSGGGTRGSLT